PRSRSETPRGLSPASSANASWVSPAATRYDRRRSPNSTSSLIERGLPCPPRMVAPVAPYRNAVCVSHLRGLRIGSPSRPTYGAAMQASHAAEFAAGGRLLQPPGGRGRITSLEIAGPKPGNDV